MSKLSIRFRQPADPQGKPFLMTIGQSPSSGQALLIILLVMAVALTIGLAIISRSVTDVRISQQTEEAARAYSAAEAGIETALVATIGDSFSSVFSETGASYQASKTGFPLPGTTEFVYPQELNQNETQTFYLATYAPANSPPFDFNLPYYSKTSIYVCWQNPQAALEITFYYKMGSTYKVARYTADSNAVTNGNSFSPPDGGSCAGLSYKREIPLTDPNGAVTPYFLRLRTLYANTKLGIAAPPGGTIPEQGTKIESSGQAGTSTRKVEVIRFHPAPPEIFDFTLYSGGDLVK